MSGNLHVILKNGNVNKYSYGMIRRHSGLPWQKAWGKETCYSYQLLIVVGDSGVLIHCLAQQVRLIDQPQ